MSSLSKTRMISFRLTDEEYEQFRALCFSKGIRSVSEMARAAIHSLLQKPAEAPRVGLESRVTEVEGRLHLLALEVRRLHQNGHEAPKEQMANESREDSRALSS